MITRKVTRQLLEMTDGGTLDPKTVLLAVLNYMSEDDVADMAHANGFIEEQEDEVLDDEHYDDGQPDEQQEWHDFDRDC